MGVELHIRLHPDAIDPAEDILVDFPFEPGQSIISHTGGLVIIDLAENQDTNYIQDWYLNGHEDVMSYYILDE